jgi:hypothetical protein
MPNESCLVPVPLGKASARGSTTVHGMLNLESVGTRNICESIVKGKCKRQETTLETMTTGNKADENVPTMQ